MKIVLKCLEETCEYHCGWVNNYDITHDDDKCLFFFNGICDVYKFPIKRTVLGFVSNNSL